jgi:hypothetical protein
MNRTIAAGLFAGAVFGLIAFVAPLFSGARPADRTASSERTPVLLELFTSEGCSDCPPADRLLESFDKSQPVKGAQLIVLSEHVGYWNHLGWKDPYSLHLFSERQETYAARLHVSDVYTPQLVVDGGAQLVGSDESGARAAIWKAIERTKVPVTLSGVGKEGSNIRLHVDVGALRVSSEPVTPGTIYIALADNEDLSQVSRGENAGHALTHVAVVRSLTAVGETSRDHPSSRDVTLPLGAANPRGLRMIAFVQDKKSGAVLGVTQAFLK